ncbi:hypothetical protein AK830_g3865 [Neonectria ditissima]|uniref:Uncharacterized protein n=1 Tax=Neonectria ditissima TaxID=78410 RepID=A0A0P7B7W3_9HYPO|nr:hypothetical protein AK830_g3865 [Neonectria ditissima]
MKSFATIITLLLSAAVAAQEADNEDLVYRRDDRVPLPDGYAHIKNPAPKIVAAAASISALVNGVHQTDFADAPTAAPTT